MLSDATASTLPKTDNIWTPIEILTWTPDKELRISEWSEKRRILSSRSAERGPFRLRRVPYLKPIMDIALEDQIERVVIMKPAQIAGTTAMENITGYFAVEYSAPIIFYMADQSAANFVCEERLQRMFEDSSELMEYCDKKSFRKNEIRLKNGGHIAISWASSTVQTGTKEAMIVIMDEIDKSGYLRRTAEASPISLIHERLRSFANGKAFLLSTPTYEIGNIAQEIKYCEVVYDWHVPCPYCEIYQPLRWNENYCWGFEENKYRDEKGKMRNIGKVKWGGSLQATKKQILKAGYQCGSCKKLWTTEEKDIAVQNGKPVPREKIPDYDFSRVGFHINRIYSMLGRSGDIPRMVDEFIECKNSGSEKKLQGFVNSTLAEPWKNIEMGKTVKEILKARVDLKPRTVPADAITLTCGIDPQKYGFYFVVRAWARDFTSWLVHYGQLSHWDDVYNLLFNTSYPIEGSDRRKSIWIACIDTGGTKFGNYSMTEEAYHWINTYGFGYGCRVFGIKGSAKPKPGRTVWTGKKGVLRYPSGKPIPGGLALKFLNTHELKFSFYKRLENAINESGERRAYLHNKVKEDYALHLMAEEYQFTDKGWEWVQIKPDNHWFDAEIYAMAPTEDDFDEAGLRNVSYALDIEKKKREAIVKMKQKRDAKIIKKSYSRPDWLDR